MLNLITNACTYLFPGRRVLKLIEININNNKLFKELKLKFLCYNLC